MPQPNAAWRKTNVGYLLFAATDRCVRDKLRVLHAGGFGAITDAQLALFHHLDPAGTRLTVIAARAGLTKQSMIELIDKAEALELVGRIDDPDDKRAKIVRFTARGRRVLDRLHHAVVEAEAGVAKIVGQSLVAEMKRELAAYSAATGAGAEAIGDQSGARADIAWRSGNIGRVFAFAARRFVQDVLSTVHMRGYREVTEVLLALFRNLDLDGTRLTDLAARAHMTKQSMREQVNRAQALGLIARQPDPADKRAKTIMFTPDGLAMLDEMRRGVAEAENRLRTIVGTDFTFRLKAGLADYVARDALRDTAAAVVPPVECRADA